MLLVMPDSISHSAIPRREDQELHDAVSSAQRGDEDGDTQRAPSLRVAHRPGREVRHEQQGQEPSARLHARTWPEADESDHRRHHNRHDQQPQRKPHSTRQLSETRQHGYDQRRRRQHRQEAQRRQRRVLAALPVDEPADQRLEHPRRHDRGRQVRAIAHREEDHARHHNDADDEVGQSQPAHHRRTGESGHRQQDAQDDRLRVEGRPRPPPAPRWLNGKRRPTAHRAGGHAGGERCLPHRVDTSRVEVRGGAARGDSVDGCRTARSHCPAPAARPRREAIVLRTTLASGCRSRSASRGTWARPGASRVPTSVAHAANAARRVGDR